MKDNIEEVKIRNSPCPWWAPGSPRSSCCPERRSCGSACWTYPNWRSGGYKLPRGAAARTSWHSDGARQGGAAWQKINTNTHKHKKKQWFRYFMQPPGNVFGFSWLVGQESVWKKKERAGDGEAESRRCRKSRDGKWNMGSSRVVNKAAIGSRGLVCVHCKHRCGYILSLNGGVLVSN